MQQFLVVSQAKSLFLLSTDRDSEHEDSIHLLFSVMFIHVISSHHVTMSEIATELPLTMHQHFHKISYRGHVQRINL